MGTLIVAEDASYLLSDVIATLLLIGTVILVVVLFRRIRGDRRVNVDDEFRVSAPAEEVSQRISAVLARTPQVHVTQPGPWQYVIVVKHISAFPAALGLPGVILASLARSRLVLQVALFQEADSIIVVRMWGASELSVVDALRAQMS